jgi:Trm5-related predicted tRNA methylase
MPAAKTDVKGNVWTQYNIRLPADLDKAILGLATNGKSKSRVLSELCEKALRKKVK